jgi:bifunctional UDP-N-acetylglucosamine pyrophosphorylase/glucosamine-1-phosphate N-acetyltransferase
LKVAIVLAAGRGIRMNSELPKVFHKLCGKPLLTHVLDLIKNVGFDSTYVVVGYGADILKEHYKDSGVVFVDQTEQLGTAHAVMQVAPFLKGLQAKVVVLAGDMPLISSSTITGLIEQHDRSRASATVLVARLDDPSGYGRMVRDAKGGVLRIVEQKDASEDEKKIDEVNTGVYCFNSTELLECLGGVGTNNAQKEYYLTDVVAILNSKGRRVSAFVASDPMEAMGVNSKEQLEQLEATLKAKGSRMLST